MYILDCEERWPVHSSLNYCTIKQLKQYCQQLDRWDEIRYVNTFMSLHNRISLRMENHLLVQGREEEASNPLPDSKAQEEKENEEANLIDALNPRDSGAFSCHHLLDKLLLK